MVTELCCHWVVAQVQLWTLFILGSVQWTYQVICEASMQPSKHTNCHFSLPQKTGNGRHHSPVHSPGFAVQKGERKHGNNHRSYRLRNRDWKQLTWAIQSIGTIRVARKTTKMHKKCEKNTKNGQKSHIFLILLTIATKQKHLKAYNLAILVDKAFFQLFVVTRSSLVQYLRCSSPNNEATSKWRRFLCFWRFLAQR